MLTLTKLIYPFDTLPGLASHSSKSFYFDEKHRVWRVLICCKERAGGQELEYVTWFNITPTGFIIDYYVFPERHAKFFIAVDEACIYRLSQEGDVYVYNYQTGEIITSRLPNTGIGNIEINYFHVANGRFFILTNQKYYATGPVTTLRQILLNIPVLFWWTLFSADYALEPGNMFFNGKFFYYQVKYVGSVEKPHYYIGAFDCYENKEYAPVLEDTRFEAFIIVLEQLWYFNNQRLMCNFLATNNFLECEHLIDLPLSFYSMNSKRCFFYRPLLRGGGELYYIDSSLAGHITRQLDVVPVPPMDYFIDSSGDNATFVYIMDGRYKVKHYHLPSKQVTERSFEHHVTVLFNQHILGIHPPVPFFLHPHCPRLAAFILTGVREFFNNQNFWSITNPLVQGFLRFIGESRKKFHFALYQIKEVVASSFNEFPLPDSRLPAHVMTTVEEEQEAKQEAKHLRALWPELKNVDSLVLVRSPDLSTPGSRIQKFTLGLIIKLECDSVVTHVKANFQLSFSNEKLTQFEFERILS